MPVENDIEAIVTTASIGAATAAAIALPKKMPRSEVLSRIILASILSATVPQVLIRYSGLDPVVSWLLGVLCGISAPEIIVQLHAFTTGWLKQKTGDLNNGDKRDEGGPKP